MSRRFLFVVGVAIVLVVSQMSADGPLANPGQPQQQQQYQPPPSTPHHVINTAPHGNGGVGSAHTNTIRTNTIQGGKRTGASAPGVHLGTLNVPHSQAMLKTAVQASTSRVQQHLYATGKNHDRHRHWRWNDYEILPTNLSSLVTSVISGDKLAVVSPNGDTQVLRLAGVAAPAPGQSLFSMSRDHLATLTYGKRVRAFTAGEDPDGAKIAQVVLSNSGISVNYQQVRDGMAYHRWDDGCAGSLYPVVEQAIDNGFGIWRHINHSTPPPWVVASRGSHTK